METATWDESESSLAPLQNIVLDLFRLFARDKNTTQYSYIVSQNIKRVNNHEPPYLNNHALSR